MMAALRRLARWSLPGTLVASLVVAASFVADAQTPQEMVSISQLDQERLPAAPFVYGAYAFVWVALVAYVFLLWRRLSRVERELADVTARIRGARRT
jgi:CcmD family protein